MRETECLCSLLPLPDDLLAVLDYPLSLLLEAFLNFSLQLVIAFLWVASVIVLKILHFIVIFLPS